MTRTIIVLRDAQDDIRRAIEWYRDIDPELADRFATQLDAHFARISERPELFAKAFGTVRRANMRRFPYSIIFEFDDDRIIVAGCLHSRRNPAAWRRRARTLR